MWQSEHPGVLPRPCNVLLKPGALETAILTSANFALIATDTAGVIQVFNVGACRMLGYAPTDMINRAKSCDLQHPASQRERSVNLSKEFAVAIAPGLESLIFKASRGLQDIFQTTFICKDGSVLPTRVSITALHDEQGMIIGYLLICTDDSEHIRVENLLKEAKRAAETASDAKSDFLSRMSHELRTPLNAILGFAQLIQTGNPAPTALQKSSVSQILNAGWYLLALINEVLDLALVESGRMHIATEPVSVTEILQECQTMMAPLADRLGIAMSYADLDAPMYVFADRMRLKQVLINLLTNAIKYNRLQGSVTVDFTAHSANTLRINVRDTGLGLVPEKLQQLFQPFNRLGREGGAEEGTGIGLVVTKRLMELMDGAIGVSTVPDSGSVFWVELRVSPAPADSEVMTGEWTCPIPLERRTIERYTVLYVEDNEANMELVAQIIARRPDVRFMSATDATQGIALAREHLPDVILMDINLPGGVSGLQALRLLQADPRTAPIPVIALSANAVPREVEGALSAGFHAYITKPLKISVFVRALDAALALSVEH
jgi:signal transduction histidine kinase/ActR/RegA family two-component response regulator